MICFGPRRHALFCCFLWQPVSRHVPGGLFTKYWSLNRPHPRPCPLSRFDNRKRKQAACQPGLIGAACLPTTHLSLCVVSVFFVFFFCFFLLLSISLPAVAASKSYTAITVTAKQPRLERLACGLIANGLCLICKGIWRVMALFWASTSAFLPSPPLNPHNMTPLWF